MQKGENMINYKILSVELKKSLDKTFGEMTLDELKKLDCLTWNADFYIEKDQAKEAA